MLRTAIIILVAGTSLAWPPSPAATATAATAHAALAHARTAATAAVATFPVFNAGFEIANGQLPAGWRRMRAAAATFRRDTAMAHSGHASARISHSSGDSNGVPGFYIRPTITVVPGGAYAAAVWARGSHATGGTRIALAWYSAAGTYLGQVESRWLRTGATPWTRLTVRGRAPAQAAFLEIHLKSSFNTGSAWFDNVTFTPPKATPRRAKAMAMAIVTPALSSGRGDATPVPVPTTANATTNATDSPGTATAHKRLAPPTATATTTAIPTPPVPTLPTATAVGVAVSPAATPASIFPISATDTPLPPTASPLPPTATALATTMATPVPRLVRQVSTRAIFGLNDHLTWHGVTQASADLDQMSAAGIQAVRVDVYWYNLEPQRDAWDSHQLSNLDGIIAAIAAHNMTGVYTVLGTPVWARNNTGTTMTPPADPTAYGAFTGQLATRYAGYPNTTWEIWNEPSDPHFWDAPAGPDAALYTRMLQSAYSAIKAHAPSATVLGGCIAFNSTSFLDGMYAAGAKGYFDALSIHPYTQGKAPTATDDPSKSFPLTVQGMEQDMANHGEPNKPIWITEMGWTTGQVSDVTRATYLQQVVSMVRSWPFVKEYDAYAMHQADDGGYGLTSDGGVTASWAAYSTAIQP